MATATEHAAGERRDAAFWQSALRRAGLRVTRQRVTVLDLLDTNSHSSAERIFAAATPSRAELGSLTLQAVYGILDGHVDEQKSHYDLYGGVGLFAATLADLGGTDIVTVESSARATQHAAANLAPLEVNAVTARVDRFLATQKRGRTGAVVLDPPRAGAGRQVVEAIHALAPDAIAYVACDPVALARDLGTFRTGSTVAGTPATTVQPLEWTLQQHD